MSSIKIICPPATEIEDLAALTCYEDFGQIQKMAFQRQYASAGVKNSFIEATNSILVKASWDAFIAAADSTKLQMTPYVENPTTTPGTARTTGGGNATIGGTNKVIGTESTTNEYYLNAYNQGIVKSLKTYMSEPSLGVFLFNEHGQIGAIADDRDTPTAYYPVPIAPRTMFVGDKLFAGLEEEDRNMLSFEYLANWSDNFVILNPTDFNPITDLAN